VSEVGRELEVTTGLSAGLVINTVPDADGLAVASELDVYQASLHRHIWSAGVLLGGHIRYQVCAANKILYKGLVFNVNGVQRCGKKTLESRLHEPFWDMSGEGDEGPAPSRTRRTTLWPSCPWRSGSRTRAS
jgi:hypothetical protein